MNRAYVRKHIFRVWRYHFALQMTTVFVLGLILVLLSFIFGVRENLNHMNTIWGDSVELTMYLKEKAPQADVLKFVQNLQGSGHFSEVHLVGRDEALTRFLSQMGTIAPDFLRSGEIENPLPASIETKLTGPASATAKVKALRDLAQEYSSDPLVDEVDYGKGWIENWAGFLTSVQMASGAAALVTILLGLLVVGNSVRVSLSNRRDEIEILELIGATQKFIRTPYILEGVVLGFIGSGLAVASGYFLQMLLFDYLKQSLSFWNVVQAIQPLSIAGWVIVTTIGVCFGAFGAYFCVRRLNSGWSAAE